MASQFTEHLAIQERRADHAVNAHHRRARALLADEAAHPGGVESAPGGAVGPDHLGGPGGRRRHRGAGAGDGGPVKT
jgi:hypothetical protein